MTLTNPFFRQERHTLAEDENDKLLQKSVIHTLEYYSLFNYPVTEHEILGNLPEKCSLATLSATLKDLVYASEIYCHKGYYSLKSEIEKSTGRRLDANTLASTKILLAKKVGTFIYKFPFVRFVGISGSLSKGYADHKSDLDFFIVTEKNRLWVCRTLLHVYKKFTFLTGRQHRYCMNYFIDTRNLEIEEQNRFTAVELSSLIPVAGKAVFDDLNDSNAWVAGYLPNGYTKFDRGLPCPTEKKMHAKKGLEYLLNIFSPEKMNIKLMQLTDKKWRKKWSAKNYPMEDYGLAFKTTLHVSKNHAANHQKRVLEAMSKFNTI